MIYFIFLCLFMTATAPFWPLADRFGLPGWVVGSLAAIVAMAIFCMIMFGRYPKDIDDD